MEINANGYSGNSDAYRSRGGGFASPAAMVTNKSQQRTRRKFTAFSFESRVITHSSRKSLSLVEKLKNFHFIK